MSEPTDPWPPDEIRVGSLTYAVELVHDLQEEGDKCNGLTEVDEHLIQLNNAMRGHETKRVVLLHELMHVLEDFAGASLKETQIDSFAKSLYSLIRDNPELMAWLAAPKPKLIRNGVKTPQEGQNAQARTD